MREFLYLSRRKLDDTFAVPSALPNLSGEVEFPFPVAKVRVGVSSSQVEAKTVWRKLKKVSKALEKDALWCGDESVMPGEWVWFDLPMGYGLYGNDDTGWVAFFAGIVETSTARHSRPLQVLLCGSPIHLLDRVAEVDSRVGSSTWWTRNATRLFDVLAHPVLDSNPLSMMDAVNARAGAGIAAVLHAHASVMREHPPGQRARVSGLARTLIRFDWRLWGMDPLRAPGPLILATPLYVQYGKWTPYGKSARER
ncbi:SAVMC3_10250 family protein [Streptomyces sp. NPDC047043]|uniref:SAVMC3_10250 family protein n=1 Tax=Streptomyces sp. NPDC047043 TaxID=3154497 RepID=UPI00340157BC